ncbi:von Willebrand factor A domain-containing protein 5B1 [Sorex araneus]|uniref:von Willebrand factor A domain-containing protein 5B1 n=1 Tax=Sorex araneus TaxID=42254 RepID=UPI0024338AF6|nr:von Willebrand factor A domain-containing protein 5B1 [Sorex araneus]
MPGLLNQLTGAALPLTASEVTSFVSGYALGLTASLTYGNLESQPFQGLFVYPLDESTTVIGFEAVIADRVVTVQIKDKAKLESSQRDSPYTGATVTGAPCTPQSGPPGKVPLDEDLERILFVVNLGTIAPMENITVFISTSSELLTLPSGAVQVLLPAVCTPTVPELCANDTDTTNHQTQGPGCLSPPPPAPGRLPSKDKHCFSTQTPGSWNSLSLAALLDTSVSNPMEYEFSFQLEIRGPCLLAGVESPTHEIRADAAPAASSAKSIIVTLASKHTFDRPVEIHIHPSEPHAPHVLVEKGDMSPGEFEQHLQGRTDFIKGMRKDSRAEHKREIIRKRLHKDILHHSVIMLNFCPDFQSAEAKLRKTHGEFIFLINRSNSMCGNINHIKEATVVALKSLMPTCLFNVIGFGSTFKTLFPYSYTYNEENLAMACENIQRMQADMGGTNILSPLKWVIRQPMHRGHPRLLFLITDGTVSNTGKVLELLRNHAFSTRCYSFGIGPNACHRLVTGLATVSKGSAEFLQEGERLQPKMIKSLKKAMSPVLSDVTVEWSFPETTEVLISPTSTSSLFPGERLVGYGIVCDASLYFANSSSSKKRQQGMLHPQESSSSVFYHSQDEGPSPDSGDCARSLVTPVTLKHVKDARPSSGDSTSHHSPESFQRRRAYSTNQITNHKLPPRTTTASDPTMAAKNNPLRKAKLQCLTTQSILEASSQRVDLQLLQNNGQQLSQGPKTQGPGARRPSLLPQGCQPTLASDQVTETWSALKGVDLCSSQKPASDSHSPADLETSHYPSLETETSSDWESPAEFEEPSQPDKPATRDPVLGKAVVSGLLNNQRLQWEVSFELGPPGPELDDDHAADPWSETFHHLAARSIIRDFEQLAEREREIEQGIRRRYQVSAVHTSKACNIISKYTAFVPVDTSRNQYLPTVVCYPNSGASWRVISSQALTQHWKSMDTSVGRPQTFLNTEDSATGQENSQISGESPAAPLQETLAPAREKCTASDGPRRFLATNTLSSLKVSETIFGSRLSLSTSKMLTQAARGFLSKPLLKAPSTTSPASLSLNYMPLVCLQLASGAFLFNRAFCEATRIPLEKLKWTSPFSCHRVSLPAHQNESKAPSPHLGTSYSPQQPSAERGAKGKLDWESRTGTEHSGKLWATVVALAWLEHYSATYFVEWELVAAKAHAWLEQQEVPEGRTQGTLRAAARQLFVLLRHWDETLEFNMLCYNPSSM